MAVALPAPPEPTVQQYRQLLTRLLPRGRAMRTVPGGIADQLLEGLAVELARVHQRATDLEREADPSRTGELLPEWEKMLGLPDPCADGPASLNARRYQVVARLTARGGSSPQYFIDVAAALGYSPVVIEEHSPFRVSISAMGDALAGDPWAHTWTVHAPVFTLFFFEAGNSGAGDPLWEANNSLLECTIQRIRPAHTSVLFAYDQPYSGPVTWGPTIFPTPAVLLVRTVQPGVTNT